MGCAYNVYRQQGRPSVADNITVLRCPTTTADGAALPDGTRQALTHVLDRVQNWLSDDGRDRGRATGGAHARGDRGRLI